MWSNTTFWLVMNAKTKLKIEMRYSNINPLHLSALQFIHLGPTADNPQDPFVLVGAAHCNFICKDRDSGNILETCCCRTENSTATCNSKVNWSKYTLLHTYNKLKSLKVTKSKDDDVDCAVCEGEWFEAVWGSLLWRAASPCYQAQMKTNMNMRATHQLTVLCCVQYICFTKWY